MARLDTDLLSLSLSLSFNSNIAKAYFGDILSHIPSRSLSLHTQQTVSFLSFFPVRESCVSLLFRQGALSSSTDGEIRERLREGEWESGIRTQQERWTTRNVAS